MALVQQYDTDGVEMGEITPEIIRQVREFARTTYEPDHDSGLYAMSDDDFEDYLLEVVG